MFLYTLMREAEFQIVIANGSLVTASEISNSDRK